MIEITKIKISRKNDLEKYNRQIYKLLVLPKRPRKILYDSIASGIEEYTAKHPMVSYEDLVKHFGSPKDLVETFIETSNYKEMNKSQKRKRKILKALLCIGIAAATILFSWIIFDLQSKMEFRDGYYVETIKRENYDYSSLPVYSDEEW